MDKIKESKRALNKLLEKMAAQILPELPQGWTKLAFAMFCTEKEGASYLIYTSPDDGLTWNDLLAAKYRNDEDMDGILDAMDTAEEIFDLCRDSGDKWSTMTWHLEQTGAFDISFGYDPISHVNDDIRRVWRKKELHS